MYKSISFYGAFNERTGYGIHATKLIEALEKLIPVYRNQPGGDVSISLLDTVTASQITTFPPNPSILLNVWESTLQPDGFIKNLKNYSQLWVASEAQRAWSIAQGIPEEFVKVVPEGVDPDIFKPEDTPLSQIFNFVHVGQWQPRKSTWEIVRAFLETFPGHLYPNVRLWLSADTLFPSDEYKSTEERLVAYGVQDDRIIPVHFEERENYIRRLQGAHCFVTCARSEGWNLPLIEAMGCGVPAITSDFGGSTEYAGDALVVRISKLIKPFGIYGNWDVPGQWAEPDYEHLAELMKDVYDNYPAHKEKALKTSEMIRTKFSWEAAAKKAYKLLEELSVKDDTQKEEEKTSGNPEEDIKAYAARRGYVVDSLRKRKAIFEVECWPDNEDKMNTLIETIKQIHGYGYPVLVSTHYPLPTKILELAEYVIYDKRDIMSGDDKPVYWRTRLNGIVEQKQCSKEYQGVAALNCFRNSVDFCRGKFDWVYQMNADMEVDLDKWLELVLKCDKPMVCIPYEGKKDGIGGGLWAGKTEVLDRVLPYLDSWKQYADEFPDFRFVVERWLYAYIQKYHDINEIGWIDIETSNRFDNVDREIWDEDDFQLHFIEGPYLNIVGISNRVYDVSYHDGEKAQYQLKQKCGTWSRPNCKYYKPWTIVVSLNGVEKLRHVMDLRGKRVLISMGSKALGDTLAWIPYVDEFRKKHDCHVICSGWWTHIYDYPEIEFVNPGTAVEDVYASYDVGCFDGQLDKNVSDWRLTPLQKVAADILGLDYEPIRPRLKCEPHKVAEGEKPYVCISEYSTMRNKLWNREGAWQKVVDYLNSIGYDVVSISAEQTNLSGVIKHNGQSIEQTITDVDGCECYIGLNAGPTWLAYALGKSVVMLTGVSEEWNDFPNPYRVSIDVCRPGCFNDPSIPMDRGWEWCPRKKDYACTREITEKMVIEKINKLIEDKKNS